MATLDLQDAYFHITIIPSHRKFLIFTVWDNHFQFKALPFGISSTPRVFTKTMVVVISNLGSQGVHIYPYFDNWLLTADSRDILTRTSPLTVCLLNSLEVSINYKVPCDTLQISLLHRCHSGFQGSQGISTRRQSCKDNPVNSRLGHRSCDCVPGPAAFGAPGLHSLCHTYSKALDEASTTVPLEAVQTTSPPSKQDHHYSGQIQAVPQMVDSAFKFVSRPLVSETHSDEVPHYGRVPHRK